MSNFGPRKGSPLVARIVLILIFLSFRATDAMALLAMSPTEEGKQVAGSVIVGAVWTTFFLAAIWCRQNWARCIFAVFLFLSVFFCGAMLVNISYMGLPLPLILVIPMIVYFIAGLLITGLPGMRALTKR